MLQLILSAFVVAAALLALPQGASDPRREVHEYLTRNGFTVEEIAQFDAGQSVARRPVPAQGKS
jgi:hypothetical protein